MEALRGLNGVLFENIEVLRPLKSIMFENMEGLRSLKSVLFENMEGLRDLNGIMFENMGCFLTPSPLRGTSPSQGKSSDSNLIHTVFSG